MQHRVEMGLDHFLHSAWSVAQVSILGEVDRAHTAAANPAHNLIARIQNAARIELLGCRLVTAGCAFLGMFYYFRFDFAG
jgi:hypothetical protein